MNEPRTIFRHCAVCGKEIEIKLSGRDHWWRKRQILEGGHFFGDIDLRRTRWSWHTKFLGSDKSSSLANQFLSNHIWWWSTSEEKSSIPNWKKPYYVLRRLIEDRLDPPERAEYWECPECYGDT